MIFDRAKAWIALFGAILTALLASKVIPVDGLWHTWLTIGSVVATAVITYETPNRGYARME